MKATARIVADCDGGGRTVVRVAAGTPPLAPRVTGPGEVHLAATASGPLGGDDVRIDVRVGPGAALTVRSVSASVVLAGTGEPSRWSMHADVADGGSLSWLPEPTVAAAGCSHLTSAIVQLGPDSRLVLREELIAGRHAEPPGLLRSTLNVERGGTRVIAQTLRLGEGPALSGIPSRAVGSLLTVGQPEVGPPACVLGPWAVVMPLAHLDATLVSALADDARSLRTLLHWSDHRESDNLIL